MIESFNVTSMRVHDAQFNNFDSTRVPRNNITLEVNVIGYITSPETINDEILEFLLNKKGYTFDEIKEAFPEKYI